MRVCASKSCLWARRCAAAVAKEGGLVGKEQVAAGAGVEAEREEMCVCGIF